MSLFHVHVVDPHHGEEVEIGEAHQDEQGDEDLEDDDQSDPAEDSVADETPQDVEPLRDDGGEIQAGGQLVRDDPAQPDPLDGGRDGLIDVDPVPSIHVLHPFDIRPVEERPPAEDGLGHECQDDQYDRPDE